MEGWDNWDSYFSWLQPRFDLTLWPVFAYHLGFKASTVGILHFIQAERLTSMPAVDMILMCKAKRAPPKSDSIIIICSINIAIIKRMYGNPTFFDALKLCMLVAHMYIHTYIYIYIHGTPQKSTYIYMLYRYINIHHIIFQLHMH